VNAPIGPLGLDADGALEVPTDFEATGWYVDGPEPGETGPSVIAGHVDDWTGPAVFHRLGALGPGDDIAVDRADGSTAMFTVRAVEEHSKDDFPTQRVYGGTDAPVLRLITCGGAFDEDARSYLGNVIVFADLASG
jgi:sortase (surface protein transpeptidase)